MDSNKYSIDENDKEMKQEIYKYVSNPGEPGLKKLMEPGVPFSSEIILIDLDNSDCLINDQKSWIRITDQKHRTGSKRLGDICLDPRIEIKKSEKESINNIELMLINEGSRTPISIKSDKIFFEKSDNPDRIWVGSNSTDFCIPLISLQSVNIYIKLNTGDKDVFRLKITSVYLQTLDRRILASNEGRFGPNISYSRGRVNIQKWKLEKVFEIYPKKAALRQTVHAKRSIWSKNFSKG